MRVPHAPIRVFQEIMRPEIPIPGVLAADRVRATPTQTDIPEVLAPRAEVTGVPPGLRERIGVQEAADLQAV